MDKDRIRQLMGYSTSPKTKISEGIDRPYRQVTVNDITLGVFREGGSIYIKESRDGGSTFDYIGGIENKMDYKCKGVSSAIKKLEYMESALLKENAQGSTFFGDGYQIMGEEDEEAEETAEKQPEAEPESEPDVDVDVDVDSETPEEEAGGGDDESSFDFVDDPETEAEDDGAGEDAEPEMDLGGDDQESDVADSGGGDEESPMTHAGKAQNHISQIDISAEEGMNAMKQVLAAVKNSVEDSEQAGEVAAELRKMAASFDSGDEKQGKDMKEGRKGRTTFANRRKRRRQIRESLELKPKEDVARMIEEKKIMNKPRIRRKMELYKEKMKSLKLMEENRRLRKGKKK